MAAAAQKLGTHEEEAAPGEALLASRWASMPKVELHVHLDGAFDTALLWASVDAESLPEDVALAWAPTERLAIRAPVRSCRSLADYQRLVSCRGQQTLEDMLKCFEIFLPSVRGRLDLIERLAEAFVARQAASNIVYTEVRYSPHLLAEGGAMSQADSSTPVDAESVVDAVTRGLRAGCAKHAIVVNQLLCAICFRPDWAESVVDLAHARRAAFPCAVVGIDIAAGESALDPAQNPESFAAHAKAFARARQLRIPATCHAGEDGDAASVRSALSTFGAVRVGHGYAVAHDEALLSECAERGVHLEVCPTSSYATRGWEGALGGTDWSSHPLKTFVARGLSVGVSTDDPAVFGTTLDAEYALCEARMGLSAADLVVCTLNAMRAAFTSAEEKGLLAARIEAAARDAGIHLPSPPVPAERGTATPTMTAATAAGGRAPQGAGPLGASAAPRSPPRCAPLGVAG